MQVDRATGAGHHDLASERPGPSDIGGEGAPTGASACGSWHRPGYVCPWLAVGAIEVDMNAKNGPADGARVPMRTLVQSGVTTLFANPGNH